MFTLALLVCNMYTNDCATAGTSELLPTKEECYDAGERALMLISENPNLIAMYKCLDWGNWENI